MIFAFAFYAPYPGNVRLPGSFGTMDGVLGDGGFWFTVFRGSCLLLGSISDEAIPTTRL